MVAPLFSEEKQFGIYHALYHASLSESNKFFTYCFMILHCDFAKNGEMLRVLFDLYKFRYINCLVAERCIRKRPESSVLTDSLYLLIAEKWSCGTSTLQAINERLRTEPDDNAIRAVLDYLDTVNPNELDMFTTNLKRLKLESGENRTARIDKLLKRVNK
jgi:hypothetical protein